MMTLLIGTARQFESLRPVQWSAGVGNSLRINKRSDPVRDECLRVLVSSKGGPEA